MSKTINENTQVKLDLKTIGIIVGGCISLASMYFVMQSDIAEAKELPKPVVSEKEAEVKSVKENTEGLPDFLSNAINKDYSAVMNKLKEKDKFKNVSQ